MEKQNKQAKLERKIKYYTENTLTHRKESTGERIIRLTTGSMKVPLFKAELKGIKEGKSQEQERIKKIIANQKVRERTYYLKGWTIIENILAEIEKEKKNG